MDYKITLGAYIYKGKPFKCCPMGSGRYVEIDKGSILYGIDNGEYMELRMCHNVEMRGQHIPMSDLEKYDGESVSSNGFQLSDMAVRVLVDHGNDINAMKNGIVVLSTFFRNAKEKKKREPVLLKDQFSDETLNSMFDMLYAEISDFFEKYEKEG